MTDPLAHSGGHLLSDHLNAVALLAGDFSEMFDGAGALWAMRQLNKPNQLYGNILAYLIADAQGLSVGQSIQPTPGVTLTRKC